MSNQNKMKWQTCFECDKEANVSYIYLIL